MLHANVRSELLNAVETGGEAGDVAVDGAFGLVVLGHESLAFIEDRAVVTADRVDLDAVDSAVLTHVAGGLAASPGVAVGVAAAFTIVAQPRALVDRAPAELREARAVVTTFEEFLREAGEVPGQLGDELPDLLGGSATRAFIGDASYAMGRLGTGGDLGAVEAAIEITVDATSQLAIWTVAVAGADSDADVGRGGGEQSVRGLEYGFGLSGDVAFNSIEHTVETYIRDVARVRAPVVRLEAIDEPLVSSLAGGLAFGTNFGIGGSFARTGLFAQTRAFTQDSTILTPDLDVLAAATPRVFAFADGGASANQNAAVAGSVTRTDVGNVVEAAIGDRTRVVTAGPLVVHARAELTGVANAGAAAEHAATGFAAVGAAVALGELVNDARAVVGEESLVLAGDDVTVEAEAAEHLLTVAAATSAGTGSGQHNRLCTNAGGTTPSFGCVDATEDDLLTTSMALADLDGDGRLDLVVGSFAQAARRYLNDGGDFEQCTLFVFCSKSGAVLGDNWFDAVTTFDPERIAGAVLPPMTLALAVGDVDLDGDIDVITGNYRQPNRLFLNDGEGNFGSGNGIPIGSAAFRGELDPAVTADNTSDTDLLHDVQRAVRQLLLAAGVDPDSITVALELRQPEGAPPTMAIVFGSAIRDLDAAAAEAAIAARRIDGRLIADVTLVVRLVVAANAAPGAPTSNIDVTVALLAADTAAFTTLGELAGYVKTVLDAALVGAGRRAGDITVRIGDAGEVEFVVAVRQLGDTAAAEQEIAAARSGPDGSVLNADVAFDLSFGSATLAVAIAAADTAGNTTAAQLIGQLQTALDAALVGAGMIAGDVHAALVGGAIVIDAVVLGLDPAQADRAADLLEARRLKGGLSGSDPVFLDFRFTEIDSTSALAVGDVDGDGDLDLVVGNIFERARVYLNNRGAVLETPVVDGVVTPIEFNLWLGVLPGATVDVLGIPVPYPDITQLRLEIVSVSIDPSVTTFNTSPEQLVAQIQAAIDAALAAEGGGNVGDIVVQLVDGGFIDIVGGPGAALLFDGAAEEAIQHARRYFGIGLDIGRTTGAVLDTDGGEPLELLVRLAVSGSGADAVDVVIVVDPSDTSTNLVPSDLVADLQDAVDDALLAAGFAAGDVDVVLDADGFLDLVAAPGFELTGDETAEESIESARRYYEIHEDLTTSIALADLDGDGRLDLVVGNVGIDLTELIGSGLVGIADFVEDVAIAVIEAIEAGVITVLDAVRAEIIDRLDFDPATLLDVETLVDLGLATLSDLADRGLVAVDDLVAGLSAAADGAGGLIDAGLVTADQLAAAGLPTTGTIPIADLVDSGLVQLDDLVADGFVTVDDLLPGVTTRLGDLLTEGLSFLDELVEAGLAAADDLLDSALVELRDLVESGLASLEELVLSGLLDADDVDLGDFDPRDLLTDFAIGAPTKIYLNVDDPLTAGFDGFGAARELESRVTKALAVGDVDGDGDIDIVTGNILSPVRVHLNDGAANFTSSNVSGDLRIVTSLVLADIDNDADDDLDIVTGNLFARTRVYLNNNDGTFAPGLDVGTDEMATVAIVAGDLDGDGDGDVVVGHSLPSIGIAGSVASVTVDDRASATVATDAVLIVFGDVEVLAEGTTDVVTIAGAAASTDEIAVGLSIANTNLRRTVTASIDGAFVLTIGAGTSVLVDAQSHDELLSFAGGVAGAGDLGVVASGVINTMDDLTEAFVTGGADIVTPDLVVHAFHDSFVLGVAGALAGSLGGVVAGAAADVELLDKTVRAWIGPSRVDVTGDVVVEAEASDEMLSFVAGLGVGLELAIAGSVALLSLDNTTHAHITGADVEAGGNVVVLADSDVEVDTLVGAETLALGGGIGVAASLIFHSDDTAAWIGAGSDVRALGATTVAVPTEVEGATRLIRGVAVVATSSEDLGPVSIGAGAAVLLGIAGSINLTSTVERTRASIDTGARVQKFTSAPIPADDAMVLVLAVDWTHVLGLAGALEASAVAGVGAGIDVAAITKETEAFVAGDVGADPLAGEIDTIQAVEILARAYEDLTSISASASAAIVAAIAGALGAYGLAADTRAFVGEGGRIRTRGNVVVSAHHEDDVDLLAGSANAALGAAVGAAAAAVVTNNITQAYIGDDAEVTALALVGGLQAPTGELVESSVVEDLIEAAFGSGAFAALEGAIDLIVNNPIAQAAGDVIEFLVSVLITPVDFPELDLSLINPRRITPGSAPLRGVSVTATNVDEVELLVVGVSASTVAGVEGSMGGLVTGNQTSAFIGDGADVNADLTGVDAAQDVRVAASSDTSFMSIAGVLVASGVASVGAAANAALIRNVAEAFIGREATVRANDDVEVLATNRQKALPITVGFATESGTLPILGLPIAGSLPIVSIDSHTRAFIDMGATVQAFGNVLVRAVDDTDIDTISGAGAFATGGLFSIGLGVSAAVIVVTKDTQAWIGALATVDAHGNGATVQVLAGTVTDEQLDFEAARGVAVQAISTEHVFPLTAAGGASSASVNIGLAGTINLTIVNADTTAFIDRDAEINTIATAINSVPDQAVRVGAGNDSRLYGIALNLQGETNLGGAGGFDIGIVHNDTLAEIRDGAIVNAVRDVMVDAVSTIEADSLVAGAGDTKWVGIIASFSMYGIRGDFRNPIGISVIPFGGGFADFLNSDDVGESVQGFLEASIAGSLGSAGVGIGAVLTETAGTIGAAGAMARAFNTAQPSVSAAGIDGAPVRFDPATAVDADDETIELDPDHWLETGDAVRYGADRLVRIDGTGSLLSLGLLTPADLTAAGLPTAGTVDLGTLLTADVAFDAAALVAAGITTAGELSAAGLPTTGPIALDTLLDEDIVDPAALDGAGLLLDATPIGVDTDPLVQLDGADSLIGLGLVTAAGLAAAGLPETGSIALADLFASEVELDVDVLETLGVLTDAELTTAGLPTTGLVAISALLGAALVAEADLDSLLVLRDRQPVGGLVFGDVYFVHVTGRFATLHLSRADALAGTNPIALDPSTATGTRHSLTFTDDLAFVLGDVDVAANTIQLGAGHGVRTGDAVRYEDRPDVERSYQVDGPGGLIAAGIVTAEQLEGKDLPTTGTVTLQQLLDAELILKDDVSVGGLARGVTYFASVDPLDASKITLHTSRTAAFAGADAIDLLAPKLDGAAFRLEPASFGTQATIDGGIVTAGRDVIVNALDVIDVAMDTSWTFNFSDSIVALAQDRGALGISGAAAAGIAGGADVSAARNVLVTGNVSTASQIMAATAMTNESDRALAFIEGPDTVVDTGTGSIDVLAHLDADSLYAAIIPFSSKGGIADSAIDIKDSSVITNSYVDAHIAGAEVTAATTVTVEAIDDTQIYAIADAVTVEQDSGNSGPPFVTVGFTFAAAEINDVVVAYIVDGVVTANGGDVEVRALSDVNVVSVSIGIGVAGSQFGGAGSLINNAVANRTEALIGGTSVVTASGSVLVHATDDTDLVSFGGGANFQSQISIGAVIGINEIANVTRAAITGGTVEALSGDVTVLAEAVPVIVVITIGLAQAENHEEISTNQGGFGGTLKYVAFKLVEFFLTLGFGQGTGGTSLAGSFSVNSIKSQVDAHVAGDADVDATGTVLVHALDAPTVVAVAGAVALSDGTAKGASVSINLIGDVVTAHVDGTATTVDAPVVDIHAETNSDIDTVALGGTQADDFALGGSVTKNEMDNTVEARVTDGAHVTAATSATVHATHVADIVTVAGNVTFSQDAVAIGASIVLNDQSEIVRTTIDGATVTAPAITVLASADADMIGIAVGGAFAENFALGGSVVFTTSRNLVETTVVNGATLSAVGGTISVVAVDDSDLDSDAGNATLILLDNDSSGGAIGLSVVRNDVENVVRTIVDGATITAATIEIRAESSADVHALSIAGGGAYGGSDSGNGFTFVGAGAISINEVKNIVETIVRNGATITATLLTIEAKDIADVRADAGSASLFLKTKSQSGGVAITVGVGVATNDVENTVTTVVAPGDGGAVPVITAPTTTVRAVGDTTVNALALGIAGSLQTGNGSGGASFVGAGSGSGNSVTNKVHSKVVGASITAATLLAIRATDTTEIVADAGAVGLVYARGPPIFAVGASIAINSISNTTIAELVTPDVLHAGDVEVWADADVEIDVLTVTFTVALTLSDQNSTTFGLAGAGAGSGNKITNTVEARVVDTTVDGIADTITGTLTVRAQEQGRIHAESGMGALAFGITQGSSGQAGAGAAAATNQIANSVIASITGSTLTVGDDIVVEATSAPTIETFTFGIAGGVSSSQQSAFAFAGAGSGSGNRIGDVDGTPAQTIARVVSSTLLAGGEIRVEARDESTITADAGGVSVAVGISQNTSVPIAVGAAVAINTIVKTVRAIVTGSTITDATALVVDASSATQSEALSIAGAGGVGVSSTTSIGVTGAGAVSINDVAATVEAIVENSTLTLSGSVSVTASEAGALEFELTGTNAADLAEALDDLGVVDADIVEYDDNGTPGDPEDDFPADPQPLLQQAADLADDAAKYAQLLAAFAANGIVLSSTTKVYVLEYDVDVDDAPHPYLLTPDPDDNEENPKFDPGADPDGFNPRITRWLLRDGSGSSYIVERCGPSGANLCVFRPALIDADAGGLALSVNVGSSTAVGINVGAAVAHNTVANHVTAKVTNTSVTGAASLTVNAATAVAIEGLAVGIAGGVSAGSGSSFSFSGAGAGTASFITNETRAELSGVTTDVAGAISVVASDSSKIRADAGAGAFSIAGGSSGGVSGAVGAGVVRSEIANTVRAIVEGSSLGTAVDPEGDVEVIATSTSADPLDRRHRRPRCRRRQQPRRRRLARRLREPGHDHEHRRGARPQRHDDLHRRGRRRHRAGDRSVHDRQRRRIRFALRRRRFGPERRCVRRRLDRHQRDRQRRPCFGERLDPHGWRQPSRRSPVQGHREGHRRLDLRRRRSRERGDRRGRRRGRRAQRDRQHDRGQPHQRHRRADRWRQRRHRPRRRRVHDQRRWRRRSAVGRRRDDGRRRGRRRHRRRQPHRRRRHRRRRHRQHRGQQLRPQRPAGAARPRAAQRAGTGDQHHHRQRAQPGQLGRGVGRLDVADRRDRHRRRRRRWRRVGRRRRGRRRDVLHQPLAGHRPGRGQRQRHLHRRQRRRRRDRHGRRHDRPRRGLRCRGCRCRLRRRRRGRRRFDRHQRHRQPDHRPHHRLDDQHRRPPDRRRLGDVRHRRRRGRRLRRRRCRLGRRRRGGRRIDRHQRDRQHDPGRDHRQRHRRDRPPRRGRARR